MKKIQFSICVDEDTLKKIDKLANNEGRSRSQMILYILKLFLKKEESE